MKRLTALLVSGMLAFSFNSALSMETCLKCHKTAEKVAENIKKVGVKSEAELVDYLKNKSSKKGIHRSLKDEEIKEAFAKISGKAEKKEAKESKDTKETEKKYQETKSVKKETTKKKTIQKESIKSAPSKNANQTQVSPSKEVTPKQETPKAVTPSQDQPKSQAPSQEKPKKKVEGC